MAKRSRPPQLVVASDDPLFAEHQAVAAWVDEALGTLGEHHYYQDVDLKSLPAGEALLAGTPEQSKRFVLAAIAQVRHWDQAACRIREGLDGMARANPHFDADWPLVWGPRRQAASVVNALLRRTLPFDRADLLTLVNWCCEAEVLSSYQYPVGSISRALERYAKSNPIDAELRSVLQKFGALLRAANDKDAKRFATSVEQLSADEPAATPPASQTAVQPKPLPAPAGSPLVLTRLKRAWGLQPDHPDGPTTVLEPDQFAMFMDSPLRVEHELLSALFTEMALAAERAGADADRDIGKLKSGEALLALTGDAAGRILLAAIERHVCALLPPPGASRADEQRLREWSYAPQEVIWRLRGRDFEGTREGLFDLLLYLSVLDSSHRAETTTDAARYIAMVAQQAAASPLTEGERYVLSLFRASLIVGPAMGKSSPEVASLTELINDGARFFLATGEVWSDAVNDDTASGNVEQRTHWANLLRHLFTATSSRPSAKWLKSAGQLISALGPDTVRDALLRWFPLVSRGRTVRKLRTYSYVGDMSAAGDMIHEENANCLRGLLWCVPLLPQPDDLARVITGVAISAYKKVPGIGPRAVKVGNAAVYALSELASKIAVGQLAILKVRVKFGSAQKEIEKAFDAAAEALKLPRDQIEELGVPSYGLEEVGRTTEEFGTYHAELLVTGSDAELRWTDAAGKVLKSVPAKVKTDHKEELKELQQSLKDIQAMLPAQRDRIDGLFLLQKTWSISEWRERYYDHPLVGTIARRLIWCVDGSPALFVDGVPCDVEGAPLEHGQTAEVTLWHPVGRSIPEVTAWRRRLEELQITQPFKQAHREVYLLTDAERNTRTYSNRFAAHIIRQHQFNALCAARGWKNKLRLMVDDSYPPPSKELPQWGLRAEFWIESIGEDYGVDTNDSGVYLRLATDQVRFYRTEAASNYAHATGGGYENSATGPGTANVNAPLPLDEIPPLVLSEIMRDVDLFVGVASVGNDPTWQDGGPQGRYRAYWQSYSFGELSGTATTRKQVLERLVPRLKIAKRCSFNDRFLVVRGDKRTYKIHLGSGNILMEPNDQYLCIVPDSRARATQDDLYLPFEGDSTLSIIISKALLLADDTKIKDPTITRQIDAI